MNLEIARKEIVINTHLGPLMHFRLFLGGGGKRLFEAGRYSQGGRLFEMGA